jgi:hypothetical protein
MLKSRERDWGQSTCSEFAVFWCAIRVDWASAGSFSHPYFLLIGYDMMYLTAIGLTPGGSSTAHIYTQTVPIIQRN